MAMVEPLDNPVNVLEDFKKPKQTTVGNLSEDDIVSIWGYISDFITKQLRQQKGVHIAGLGTFTFSHKNISKGKKPKEINRPVFIVSEKFVLTHALPAQKQYRTGEVPVVPLNFAAIAFESPFHRDVIESSAKEVLNSLGRSVSNNSNVEFVFSGLGRLTIRDKKVKMRFFKEFISSLDDSSDVLGTMMNRPFTPDSVMTDRPMTSRTDTATLILPSVAIARKPLGAAESKLPAIAEDAEQSPREEHGAENPTDSPKGEAKPKEQEVEKSEEPKNEDIFQGSKHIPLPPAPTESSGLPEVRKPSGLQRSLTSPNIKSHRPKYLSASRPESASRPGSECGHRTPAGQELCYLCHQRDVRNQPVDFSKERQRRIEEEDRLLAQYQHLRDTEAILKEQEKFVDAKQLQQNISAFNLGVADAIKEEKAKKPDYHPSFVFQRRPHTPHKFFGQAQYYEELNNQVGMKHEREKKVKADQQFLEKLEQIQLAEDLAAQREAYLKEKYEQKSSLQRALDTQLKYMPEQLPKAVPDSDKPIFGLHDGSSNDKLIEKAKRETENKQELLRIAREKKKEAILQDLLNQKEEEEMLADVKKELKEDYINRHNRVYNQRRSLENDWLRSMQVKQAKEDDENKHRMMGGSMLLDQAHISRCLQCQRKIPNKGSTNLWKETYYVPGSRLIL